MQRDWEHPVPLSFTNKKQKSVMSTSETLGIIKDSFEKWYNGKLQANEKPVSIVINYSDVQTLSIKAFHTITMEVTAVGIRENLSFTAPLVTLKENYNHGITSEQEAKDRLTGKLLVRLFDFSRR